MSLGARANIVQHVGSAMQAGSLTCWTVYDPQRYSLIMLQPSNLWCNSLFLNAPMYSVLEESNKTMQVMLECSVFHVLSHTGAAQWYYVPVGNNMKVFDLLHN